jgi:hypothetical protein
MQDEQQIPDDGELSRIIAETRALVREAAQLIDQPMPDSFLGRKTQEPFPAENIAPHHR